MVFIYLWVLVWGLYYFRGSAWESVLVSAFETVMIKGVWVFYLCRGYSLGSVFILRLCPGSVLFCAPNVFILGSGF